MQDRLKKVTIRDVANHAGVSVATVSRVLQGSPHVLVETAARIQQAVDTLGYVPDRAARTLKTRRSNQIVHVVPDVLNPYYARMYRRVQQEAERQGYSVLLVDTLEQEERELQAIATFEQSGADGIIFGSIRHSEQVLDRLVLTGRPVVLTNSYSRHLFDTLHGVAGRGITMATEHLLGLGHRAIAYAGGPAEASINSQRREGYLAAMGQAGLNPPRDYLFEMDFTMEGGYRAGIYFSGIPTRPTAIVAANDLIAIGIMQAFHERGISIPQDISLTGEDNIDIACICRPGLTTIHNPSEYIAEHAIHMLIERIEGRYTGPPRSMIMPRELIIRQSTAAPQTNQRS